jgi:DNA sulfur modification protein DndE
MGLNFRDEVWRSSFSPTEESAAFEDRLRTVFGLQHKYDSARLLIGRSLAEPEPPEPLGKDTAMFGRAISGELLFGDKVDLWICALTVDGKFSMSATFSDFKSLVEAHWARGFTLVRDELERCERNETTLVQRLCEILPEGTRPYVEAGGLAGGAEGEIKLRIGSTSRLVSTNEPIEFTLNGPSTAPNIALMGGVGKGKTTTGTQMAIELVRDARIPLLFIDPKGEFVADGRVSGALADLGPSITGIEVTSEAIPLDFLPHTSASGQRIARAAMRMRDTLMMCCRSPGDLQKDLLKTAIQDTITAGTDRSLEAIRDRYERQLLANGKQGMDSIISRLNEVTDASMPCFTPQLQPAQFFSRSWVISLKLLPEELKRLVTLLLLDATYSFLIEQDDSPVPNGFRVLRHLLVVDEARKILREKRSESLVDLIRQGRSKGAVVMLLSQDPSDFEGEADDFLSQIGTVVAFACNQSRKGLGSLEGVFGRKLQAAEFTDTQLEPGVAFVKLPGREPDRIRCWTPGGGNK